MDVFGFAVAAGGDLMRDAAIDCAYELGVFEGGTLDEIADRAKLGTGRWRLRAVLDVLVALGVLARDGARVVVATVPPRPVVPRAGWGLAAQVIRTNRALDVEGGGRELAYHLHLCRAGAAPAAELWTHLRGRSLADLGGGAGTYTRAFLAAGGERATIVDFDEVIALARHELAAVRERVHFVSSEISTAQIDRDHDIALLANVLHLHAAEWCAGYVAAAARAIRPGGVVAIKELRVDEDRRGPLEGLLFAMNMALYTGGGDVYLASQLRAWLEAAGLVDVREVALASAPDGICLVATKPETS